MHRKLGSLVAVALVLSATGCGGGGSGSGSGGGDTLTHAELVKQADVACKQARDNLTAAQQQISGSGQEAMVAMANLVLKQQRDLIGNLDDLDVSDDDAGRWDTYLSTLRKENGLSQDVVEKLSDSGSTEVEAGSPEAAISHDRDVAAHKAVLLAKDLGMKECAA